MRNYIEHTLSCSIWLIGMMFSQSALAQDSCKDLDANEVWNDGMKQLSNQIQNGQYDDARLTSKLLSEICRQSPVLNYMQGKIAEGQGNRTDALLYYQKASEYTYTFAVAPDMAKKIWYARYENEHPERTAKSIQERGEKVQLQLEANSERIQGLENKLYQVLWTGAGIGIAGLAILGTGVGLLFAERKRDPIHSYTNADGYNVYSHKNSNLYTVSWALVGAGAAFTVAGAVVTGIYGYQYTHLNSQFSLSMSLFGASLTVEF